MKTINLPNPNFVNYLCSLWKVFRTLALAVINSVDIKCTS